MAPPRPTLPEHLAIVFPIDKYDAWYYLSQGHLYLPSTAKTGTGVTAIGLTGNLKLTGPIGMFWEDEKAVLVMPGRAVQQLNLLSPIYYKNVDALVAGNFRALRRIVDAPYVSFVTTYCAEALMRASSPALDAALNDPRFASRDEMFIGPEFINRLSAMTAVGTAKIYENLYTAFIAGAGTFNTFNELIAKLNRFVATGAQMLVSMLPVKNDAETVFYWGDKPFGKTDQFLIQLGTSRGDVVSTVAQTIKLGDLKRGASALRSQVPTEMTRLMREMLAGEGEGFEGEIEWLANPTPDRRTGGLSVFLNVPPGSILYLIGRSIYDVEDKIIPMSLRGMWVVGVPSDMTRFELYDQAMRDALYDYANGIIGIKKLRSTVAKIEKKYKLTVLEPNPYWLVRG